MILLPVRHLELSAYEGTKKMRETSDMLSCKHVLLHRIDLGATQHFINYEWHEKHENSKIPAVGKRKSVQSVQSDVLRQELFSCLPCHPYFYRITIGSMKQRIRSIRPIRCFMTRVVFVSSVPSVVLQNHNREHEAKNPFNPSNPMFYDKSCFRVFRAIRSFYRTIAHDRR